MSKKINQIKRKLDAAISQISASASRFSKHPQKDFRRKRKLPFQKVLECILALEGGTLSTELLKHFGCSADIASPSAFVQQRSKLSDDTFPTLFSLFVKNTDSPKLYKGLRLIAADGSDIQILTNPAHTDSYFAGTNGQAPYNLLHLDAMYDLCQNTYVDAVLGGKNTASESFNLCKMIERSELTDALIIADRGYESYNLMAHIQEKGWYFLIRIQDVLNSRGIAAGFNLPHTEEFDLFVDLSLTKKQTKEVRLLAKDRNKYRILAATSSFDYLPAKSRKHDPAVFYNLPFRIVRFQIADGIFETVVTNLNSVDFPKKELKKLYSMRWGIETAFRELKYTVGLLHFHAKKVEYIYQEVFARLTMYNFTELVTSHVIIQNANTKYLYKANFTVAVHVCRQLFLGNVSPPDVEALIQRHTSPIRPGRRRPRKMTAKHAVSFLYRVA